METIYPTSTTFSRGRRKLEKAEGRGQKAEVKAGDFYRGHPLPPGEGGAKRRVRGAPDGTNAFTGTRSPREPRPASVASRHLLPREKET
jgi:hypothetical protein